MAPTVQVFTRRDLQKLSVVGSQIEILDWWLYDTLTFVNGDTSKKFFQQAAGTTGVTRETTNMDISSQLPSGHKFVAQKIVLSLFPVGAATAAATLTDLRNIVNSGLATFTIGSRNYMEVPINNLIGGSLYGFGSNGAAVLQYAQGKSVVNGMLEYSPVIPQNYNFSVSLAWDTGPSTTANVALKMQLVGKLLRPVQG